MNVLGILGSPRRDGASARLLDAFLDEMKASQPDWTTRRLDIASSRVSSCTGCDTCLKAACPLDAGDDFPAIHDALVDANIIVVASPVYFFNVPGILKDVIDRTRRAKMNGNELKNKLFGTLVAQGLRNGGGEVTILVLHAWALSHAMIPVSAPGNPVIENPLAVSPLQKDGLKSFRKPSEPDEIGDKAARRLAGRMIELGMMCGKNTPPDSSPP